MRGAIRLDRHDPVLDLKRQMRIFRNHDVLLIVLVAKKLFAAGCPWPGHLFQYAEVLDRAVRHAFEPVLDVRHHANRLATGSQFRIHG